MFEPWLKLEPLLVEERIALEQLRKTFQRYLRDGQVLEGQVRMLAIAPLLQFSGFYRSPLQIWIAVLSV